MKYQHYTGFTCEIVSDFIHPATGEEMIVYMTDNFRFRVRQKTYLFGTTELNEGVNVPTFTEVTNESTND